MIPFFLHNFNTNWSILNENSALIIPLAISFVISLLACGAFVFKLNKLFAAKARPFTPDTHKAKDNIPSMGGICILIAVLLGALLVGLYRSKQAVIMILGIIASGLIGGLDDWGKINKNCGISARLKFWLQIIVATVTIVGLMYVGLDSSIHLPLINITINSYYLYVLWSVFIIVGTSNAVNLTDGLDGLATGCLVPNFIVYAIIACALGAVHSAALALLLVGSCLGFLWFNAHPAQLFMGDVGSLSLGTALALLALVTKTELLLPITGIIFVAETCSVMLQILSYAVRSKRLFKMAPIHHHFELSGWQETKITTRFIIITVFMCLLSAFFLQLYKS